MTQSGETNQNDVKTIPLSMREPVEMPTLPPSNKRFDTQQLGSDTDTNRGAVDESLPDDATIGPFRIVRKLGQGGMGTVFEAEHQATGQRVALKLLARSLLATNESIERFQRESQIAASINHPRSTFVYEAGELDGMFYITMELMTGGTLKEVVEEHGPLPVAKAIDYILDVIDGLQPAHEAGVVHRDLKPSNCFMDHGGRVKLGDFGLAKSFLGDSSLTRTGTFMGTPQFAAPEQLRASEVDEKADIYALGATVFYLLTGRAPFTGNAAQVISSIASDPAPDIRSIKDGIPKELARIINRTLEKNPTKRPENLVALRSQLLPFSARGVSQADLGRRLAAFFIDAFVAGIVVNVVAQMVSFMFLFVGGLFASGDLTSLMWINVIVQFCTLVAYFAVQEWQFGSTLGKWLMGMRVIDQRNEPPRLIPALVRAMLIPGLSQLCISLPVVLMGFDLTKGMDNMTAWRMIVETQMFHLLSWIPNLVCLSSARLNNGYRGIHDRLTGTRVVRLAAALEHRRPENIPVTLPIATAAPDSNLLPQLGTLLIVGRFGSGSPQKTDVLLARDQSLDRDVWMIPQVETDGTPSDNRTARPHSSRIRMLKSEFFEGQQWLICEALKGIPLHEFLMISRPLSWSSLLPLMQDLVEALEELAKDPSDLAAIQLDQFWLDQSGRVKLLAAPLHQSADDSIDVSPSLPQRSMSNRQAIGIVETLLDTMIQQHVMPEHVLDWRNELRTSTNDQDGIPRLRQQLSAIEDRPSTWKWDDRMGVLAATLGIEYSTLFSLTLGFSLVANYFFGCSIGTAGVITFLVCSLIVLLAGYLFRGGPAFRLSGVSVRRNSDLSPAAPVRCAIRCWVSWSMASLSLGMLAMLSSFGTFGEAQGMALGAKPGMQPINIDFSETDRQSTVSFESFDESADVSLVFGLLVAFIPVTSLIVVGCAYSLFRPSRGIADLICGTKLIRE